MSESARRRRLRVLVIDDEPLICRVADRVLSPAYDVTTTISADEALRAIEEAGAFDAIVCDVRMPGMGGFELHRRVEERWPGLGSRFVFVTGGMDKDDSELVATGRERLTKPFAADALRAAIRAVTGSEGRR